MNMFIPGLLTYVLIMAMSVMRFIEMHMDTATIAGDDLMDAQVT